MGYALTPINHQILQNYIAKMQSHDWDDLRLGLAIARAGSLNGAADLLAVNPSTVHRRLKAAESRLGVRLFDRAAGSYRPTAAGEAMVAAAGRIEDLVADLERGVIGADQALQGPIRITAPDTLCDGLLPAILGGFRAAHPGVTVELVSASRMFNLTKREADIAIRPGPRPTGTMVGRKIADIAFALYGTHDLAQKYPEADLDHLVGCPIVDGDENFDQIEAIRQMRKSAGDGHIALRCNQYSALQAAVRAGVGFSALPCFVGDSDASLVRIGRDLMPVAAELWLLTHEDLRRTARIRAFMDYAAEALTAERDRFEGKATPPG